MSAAPPTLLDESDLMLLLQAACGRAGRIKSRSLLGRIFFHGTVLLDYYTTIFLYYYTNILLYFYTTLLLDY